MRTYVRLKVSSFSLNAVWSLQRQTDVVIFTQNETGSCSPGTECSNISSTVLQLPKFRAPLKTELRRTTRPEFWDFSALDRSADV